MTRKFREAIANGYIFVCFIGLIISVMFLVHSVAKLQDQIDHLRQRNEVITQQLQEMNRYVKYPGG